MKFKELVYERPVKDGAETFKKEPDEPKITIFTILNQLWTKKEKYPYDKKIVNKWVLTNWISHSHELIDFAHYVTKNIYHMTDEMVYKYYFHNIPKMGKHYIKWARKNPVSLKRQKIIEDIMEEYEISKREAMITLNFKERLQNGS